jgi:serine/threonine protein kinase/tetratricopeptide (TPR) repeat protein
MGEVYLAQDTKLDRNVAIKFLHEEFSRDADKLDRFIQEAKAASALNHPNILTVHEIGEVDGKNYIAAELIDGKTLREHLSQKEPLPLNTILKLGVQVAEALSAAHQAGIIHRDIKPENIMLRTDGYAKVLDFGLAKLSEPGAVATGSEDATRAQINTTPGIVMGTVFYMSPEQARGKETDARTDIWSLGVVLYEMLARKVPFTGETVNHTIVAILEKEPLLLGNVPGELQRIIRKALTKDVEMRYQSARDLLIDLKNLRRDLDIQGELERSVVPNREAATGAIYENKTRVYAADLVGATRSGQAATTQGVTTSASSLEYAVTQAKSHKLISAIVAIVLMAAISTIAYFAFAFKSSARQIESIAVMPFVNQSGNEDVEYVSDGMTETLISSLSQLPNLNVKARSSVFRYKGKATDPKTIGKELNVQAILNGRVVQRGDQLTLSLELVDAITENVIWSEQYNRKQTDLVTLQSEIARDVSSKLKTKLSGPDEQKLTKNKTVSPEAYQAYLKGLFYYHQFTDKSMNRAIEYFNQAINLDPNYADAYVGLALTYNLMSSVFLPPKEAMPKSKQAILKALALDGSNAEAHLALAEVYLWGDWDFSAAEQEYKRSIELNPNNPAALSDYAMFLSLTLERFDEATVLADRALELDSISVPVLGNIARTFYYARKYDRSIEVARKMVELDPNSAFGHTGLGNSYFMKGQHEQAGTELQRVANVPFGQVPADWQCLAYAGLAMAGHKSEAQKGLAELQALSGKRYVPQYSLAITYFGLGDKERVFQYLEKAFEGREDTLLHLKTEPLLDGLHSDPRFKDLVRRVGLPQ